MGMKKKKAIPFSHHQHQDGTMIRDQTSAPLLRRRDDRRFPGGGIGRTANIKCQWLISDGYIDRGVLCELQCKNQGMHGKALFREINVRF